MNDSDDENLRQDELEREIRMHQYRSEFDSQIPMFIRKGFSPVCLLVKFSLTVMAVGAFLKFISTI